MAADQPFIGAHLVARCLRDLGVPVVFGLVGFPIVEIAEACIDSGIRFIGFRNEQAAAYAAGAYGYLTGRPGVCLVTGGPGVLHAIGGVGNANANGFPLLLLAGSNETQLTTKGAFQEMDAVSLLNPHTKVALRASSVNAVPLMIENAYRAAWFGRAGTGLVDLPAEVIHGPAESMKAGKGLRKMKAAPVAGADPAKIFKIAQTLKAARAPLVIVGKGVAYSRAEDVVRELIDKTSMPFLPSPMGKGIIPDSHPGNATFARSVALKEADVVLVLGARLNWIFAFGEAPKWNPAAKIIQIDICAEELGSNTGDPDLGVLGDVGLVVSHLLRRLTNWRYNTASSPFMQSLAAESQKHKAGAEKVAETPSQPLSFPRAYHIIKNVLHSISPPSDGRVVYVAEGANTMDHSRISFPIEHPRLRLDAGTYATMGVGLGYAIAAHEAYNSPTGVAAKSGGKAGRKKIVCLEGDSAFGFSGMEVETMARYGMDVLIFVMNNSGIYLGTFESKDEWEQARRNTMAGKNDAEDRGKSRAPTQVRSASLGFEVDYHKVGEGLGAKSYFVRTEEELEKATREGYEADVPVVVNVVIESGRGTKLVSLDDELANNDQAGEGLAVAVNNFADLYGYRTLAGCPPRTNLSQISLAQEARSYNDCDWGNVLQKYSYKNGV